MPTFEELLKMHKRDDYKQQLNQSHLPPGERLRQARMKKLEEQNPDRSILENKNSRTERASFGDGKIGDELYDETQISKRHPGYETAIGNREGQVDEQGFSLDSKSTLARGFIDNTAGNFKKGLGDFIGGWGDIFQVAGAGIGSGFGTLGDFDQMMLDGNALSNAMKQYGGQMSAANDNYIPPEIQTPEFSISTFLNPEFWSTHGGQFIPQLTEILATIGVSGLAKKGVQVGLRTAFAEAIEAGAKKGAMEVAAEITENSVKKGLIQNALEKTIGKKALGEVAGTTAGRYLGAESVNTVTKGSGLLGRILTDRGTLTKGFGDLVQGATGGAITNLTVSLRNAAEVFNTYKGMVKTDANGQPILGEDGKPIPMFTKEELGDMAVATFATNSQYILADMLSWGMTYGKGWDYLGNFGGKLMSKVAPKTVENLASGLLTKQIAPVFKNIGKSFVGKVGKLAGEAAFEGMEETIQESYEEWSKMKGYYDVHGSLDGYQGPKAKDYDMKDGIKGFWDYYKSKDSEAIRAISFGLGAMAGGVFNVKTLVDKTANDVYKFQNRSENLQQIFEKGTEGKAWQDRHIRHQMAELVMENKGGLFAEFTRNLYEEGKIDEDEMKKYGELYDNIASQYSVIKDLNIKGKKAFMYNAAHEHHFNSKIEEATQNFKKNREVHRALIDAQIEDINNSDLSPEQKISETKKLQEELLNKEKQEEKIFKQKISPLANMIAQVKENQKNLLLDKKANPVEYDVEYEYDPDSGYMSPTYVEREKNFNMSEDERQSLRDKLDSDIEGGSDSIKSFTGKLKKGGEAVYNGIMDFINGISGDKKQEENKQDTSPNNIQEQVSGSIDALKSSLTPGAQINLDGLDSTITNVNEDGTFDYEQDQQDHFVGQEVIVDGKKGKIDNINDNIGRSVGGFDFTENSDSNLDYTTSDELKSRQKNVIKDKDGNYFIDGKKVEVTPITNKKTVKAKIEGDKITNVESGQEIKYSPNKDVKSEKESNTTTEEKSSKKQKKNDRIIEVDKEESAPTRSDVSKFRKDGTINSNVYEDIVSRKVDGRKLSKTQEEMYSAFKEDIDSDVENIISGYEKMLSDENLSNEDRDLIQFMILNSKKNKLSENNDVQNLDEKTNFSSDDDWTRDGRSKRELINNLSRRFNSNAVREKGIGFIDTIFSKLKKVMWKANKNFDETFGQYEMGNLAESIQISYALNKIYPDLDVNVYNVVDMQRAIGRKDFGYMLAGQIYIDDKVWNQPQVLMHEVSHIYYELNKNEPETKAMVNYALKDKKLVGSILSKYDDQIMYRNPKTGEKLTKLEILGNSYYSLSQDIQDNFFDNMVEQGKLEELPLEEQDIIVDEVFVAKLEGPMSEKYSRFFEELPAEEETKRQFFAKKFWSKVKKKGDLFSNKDERKLFFEALNENEQQEYSDSLNHILDTISSGINGKDLSARGRSMTSREENQRITKKLESIEKNIDKEGRKLLEGKLLSQWMKDNNVNLEDLIDVISFDTVFNYNRLQYSNKIMDVVNVFTSIYNKSITIQNRVREGKKNWNKQPYLNAERLRYKLTEVANQSWSGSDFIRRLEESNFDEVSKFMNFLDVKSRDDKNLMLQTLWWHEKNISNISSFKTYVNEQGKVNIENNLNNRELSMYENILDKVVKPFIPSNRSFDPLYNESYNKLINSATKIYNGDYTDRDLFNILEAFSSKEMDLKSLWENDRININGKVYGLKQSILSFVKGPLVGNMNQMQENGVPVFGLKNKHGQYKPEIRTFIKSLINENRKYTSNFTTIYADGNQHSSRIVDNYLNRQLKDMKSDAAFLSKKEFYQKYSNINNSGKGSRSNQLLDFIYDRIKSGKDIDLMEYGGIQNDSNDGKSVVLDQSDAATNRLNEFLVYLKSSAKTYLMDLGRFSDASRSYFMEVPHTDLSDVLNFENGKFNFQKKAILDNIYNTHKELGYEGSYNDFKSDIESAIKESVDFVESNLKLSDFKDESIAQYFKNGKLTKEGKLKVASFELNQIINGTNFTEIYFPSYKMNKNGENELVKRAKSGLSPMYSFPNLQIENIFVDDINQDGMNVTDSGFYILESDAEKLKMAGGTLMPLGDSFKLLQTGNEKYNKNWKNQNIYNKGYATVLNDEVVAKNPSLKGVYELMKMRKEKYEKMYGKTSDNLLDGKVNYMNIVVPYSSNKNKANMPVKYDSKIMNFDAINTLVENGFYDSINYILDEMYYYDDGEFVGFSGNNFGIQQVMDISKNKINSSIQFLKSLSTNMMINENEEEINDILQSIKNLLQKQIEDGFELITNGDENDVREFFKQLIDEDKIDKTQFDVLMSDKLKLQTPYLRQLVKNTFANYVKKNGLKLQTPGDILREKPSTYSKVIQNKDGTWRKIKTSTDINSNTGNSDLSFYNQNSDGSYSLGEVVVSDKMLEIGVSDLNKKRRLEKRKYFISNNIEQNLIDAKNDAKRRGVSIGKVFDENDNHIGYYAQGDAILATRIPSHGPQSTGVFEIIDSTGEKGNNIQLPNKFKRIIGSDNDGDQIFVQHKGWGQKEWNSIFDKIQKHYLNEKTQNELQQGIDFKDDAQKAINVVEELYGKRDSSFVLPFSSKGREIAFKDTLTSKGNVGIAADLHTTLRMMSSYGVRLNTPISIDGEYVDRFFDSKNKSITIASAKLFNIILDNSKYGFADKLGINTNTINFAMVLTNLGYDLDKVASVLNHPIVIEYSRLKNSNSGVLNSNTENVFDSIKSNPNFKFGNKKLDSFEINTNDINGSSQAVFELLQYIDAMSGNEIKNVGNILSLHNTMTVNAFEIDGMIEKFNSTVNNEDNKNLQFSDKFKNNPLVQNYIDVLKKNKDIQEKIDPIYSEKLSKMYKEILDLSTKEFSKENHQKLHDAVELFHTAQLLGLNHLEKKSFQDLIDPKSEKNIFTRLKNQIVRMDKSVIELNRDNPSKTITALDQNLLFSKGINFNFGGNNKYISLNSEFHQNMIDNETRNQMIQEFSNLPIDLQNDLIAYDLMKNGWKGPNSLFPLFRDSIKMQISNLSDKEFNYSERQMAELKNAVIKNNPKFFNTYDSVFDFKNGKRTLKRDVAQKHPGLFNQMKKGYPVIFKTQDASGKLSLVKFNGFSDEEMATIQYEQKNSNNQDFYDFMLKTIEDRTGVNMVKIIPNNNPNLDYIAIPSTETNLDDNKNQFSVLKEIENRLEFPSENKNINSEGRSMRSDYYNFFETMDRQRFDDVMEYQENYDELSKQRNYQRYLEEKSNADRLVNIINEESVKKMSYDELLKLYGSEIDLSKDFNGKYGEGIGFGWRNKFAYAQILRPIVLEIANREAAEQNKMIKQGVEKHNLKNPNQNKDLSLWDKWLISNNISSEHPAVQSVVRKLENEYKIFQEEKKKYVSKINDATDALYQEQFGYSPNSGGFKNTLKNLYNQLFTDKKDFYEKLYGNLIQIEEITDDKTGKLIQNMKYKTEEQIESEYKQGKITPAQYGFYKATRDISKEMIKYTGADERADYIPHTAPTTMEAFSRRGLLGVAVNAKTIDEQIYDVRLDAVNPLTGKLEKGVLFKEIENWYNAASKQKASLKKSAEFISLKRKAIALSRKGINQDGTNIRYAKTEVGSALGDTFVERFSKSRSVKSTDFPSLDLNKAFTDYVHSSLFVHGNDKFNGMKKMLPLVDGILAQSDRDQNSNMSNYIEKVWKNYFLEGKKQDSLPNNSYLESVGLTTDKVVDYLTKGSLIYWLGWKGLALGSGAYVVGNVLVGKYKNIINAGGENWKNGEKRFWLGKSGKIDVTNPLKGAMEAVEILKNNGYMDLNIYDNVSMEKKSGIEQTLMGITLMPMVYSEKWIQGAHFLGLLTEQEWDNLKNGGKLSVERLNEIEEEVKNSHGKGYQPTDQRMIQMYSWGRMMMQFSRFIPTTFYDKFSKEDIDRYGNYNVGSYRKFYQEIQKGIDGRWTPKQFVNYIKNLDPAEQKRFYAGMAGFGMVALGLAGTYALGENKLVTELMSDDNVFADFDRMQNKLVPPAVSMVQNIIN